MKKFFLLSVFALVTAFSFAQVTVSNVNQAMSLGDKPALMVRVNGVDDDEALKDLASYWKDQGASASRKNDEMLATEYKPKDFKPTAFTLYGIAKKDKDGSNVYLWVNNGSEFLTPSQPQYKHFELKLKEYAVAENRKPIEKELKEANKALEKLSNKKASVEKDRKDWQHDIDDCNATIKKTESKLKDSTADLSDLDKQIKQQQSDVDKIKARIDAVQ